MWSHDPCQYLTCWNVQVACIMDIQIQKHLPPPNSEYDNWIVCMPVSNITVNTWTDFPEIFRIASAWNKEHFEAFWVDCFTLLKLGNGGGMSSLIASSYLWFYNDCGFDIQSIDLTTFPCFRHLFIFVIVMDDSSTMSSTDNKNQISSIKSIFLNLSAVKESWGVSGQKLMYLRKTYI